MALLASKVKIVSLSQERRQLTVFMRKWFSEKYYVALALTWLCVHSCKVGLVLVRICTSFMWIENILSFICITQRLSHSMFDACRDLTQPESIRTAICCAAALIHHTSEIGVNPAPAEHILLKLGPCKKRVSHSQVGHWGL
jgi:hypothetical protein